MTKNQARMGTVKIREAQKSVKDLHRLLAKAREDIDEGDMDYDAMQAAMDVCLQNMNKASMMFKQYGKEKLEDVPGSKGIRPGFGIAQGSGMLGRLNPGMAWRSRT